MAIVIRNRAAQPIERINVAGVIDQSEADMLLAEGVRNLGFPFRLDTHTEDLSERDANRIIVGLPKQITAFAITYLNTAPAISDLCTSLAVSTVQLHGPVDEEELEQLRSQRPDLTVIKSLIVATDLDGWHPDDLLREAETIGPLVDAFITDTFDPVTGASGATGKTHDWAISRDLVAALPEPVILAGGLTPTNVAEAIATVRPAAVDVHTGIEDSAGRKDPSKTAAFLAAATAAFANLD